MLTASVPSDLPTLSTTSVPNLTKRTGDSREAVTSCREGKSSTLVTMSTCPAFSISSASL
jgi:hypothetical protein